MSEIFYPVNLPTPINTNINVSNSNIGKTYVETYTKDNVGTRLGFDYTINLNGSNKISYSIASGYYIWFSAFDYNNCYLGQSYAYGWKDGSGDITFQPQVKHVAIFFAKGSDQYASISPADWSQMQCLLSIAHDYPDLPIVTTPEGFPYTKGYNLLKNTSSDWSEWRIPGEGTSKTGIMNQFWLKDVGFNEKSSLVYQFEIEIQNATAGTIHFQGTSNSVWDNNNGTYFLNISSIIPVNSGKFKLTELNNKITKFVSSPYTLTAKELSRAYKDGLRGEMNLGYRFDNANAEAKMRWRCMMIEYGIDASDYRPNPADLVGGGVANGYCS